MPRLNMRLLLDDSHEYVEAGTRSWQTAGEPVRNE
jgi:hypothetical protein